MSGVLKSIGKVFRKVGKIIKKVALPALAIGAVVLTGGAALGALPSVGSVAGSLGLSSGLTTALTSAARMATMGAATSALTGGNILKGATSGFLMGGALGGLGMLQGGTVPGASGPAVGAGQSAANGVNGSGIVGGGTATPGGQAVTLPGTGATITLPGGMEMPAVPSQAQSTTATVLGSGGGGGLGTAAASGVVSPSNPLAFLNNNPVLAGSLIQGIGSGLAAKAQYKAQRAQEEREAANYADTSALFKYTPSSGQKSDPANETATAIPYANSSFVYDKSTGRVRLVQGG